MALFLLSFWGSAYIVYVRTSRLQIVDTYGNVILNLDVPNGFNPTECFFNFFNPPTGHWWYCTKKNTLNSFDSPTFLS